jgi:hypothetical protein
MSTIAAAAVLGGLGVASTGAAGADEVVLMTTGAAELGAGYSEKRHEPGRRSPMMTKDNKQTGK